MKYWISLVNTVEVDQFVAIAQKAEELGYEGITVPDHLVYPAIIDTPYPYTEDGRVWWPKTNPWADPWVTLTAMGVATSKLRLATNITWRPCAGPPPTTDGWACLWAMRP